MDLEKLRKSKNIQSYTLEAFKELHENEKTVVIGTPCQIQGFYNVFGDNENILYVEMDCMGPAGSNLLIKYVDYLNNINSSGIRKITMKEKSKDWLTFGVRVEFEDGTEYYSDKYKDPFCVCFNFAHTIQDTCLKYCRWIQKSAADIRIGDAWDYAGRFPYKIVKNGLSLVSVQSPKGMKWIKYIQPELNLIPVKRPFPQKSEILSNKKIFESLRNEDQTILDAVKIYHDVPFHINVIRKAEEILSRNFYVYILSKRIKRFLEKGH